MITLIDTARPVKIARLKPGAVFKLHEHDVTPHHRIADDSPHLAHRDHHRRVYSLYRGQIVEHERDAIGLVLDLDPRRRW